MSQLVSILTLIGALAVGILAGRIAAVATFAGSRVFTALRNAILFLLVFTMGFRIGRTDEVIGSIPTLGLTALAFAAATVFGTLALLALLFSFRSAADPAPAPERRRGNGGASALQVLKEPLTLLAILIAGFFCGLLVPFFRQLTGAGLITAILYVLLVVIGVGLSAGGVNMSEIITHPALFLIPLATAAGSLLGGLAAGLALRMRIGTALALSSGFGWYSLSGVILTQLDGPITGSIAFLSNMLRESMSLILIPLLSRTRFPYLAIGAGGATSMDVTLPLIVKNCGPRSVGFALASGGLLSLAVPILVPLLYHLG